MDDVVSTEPDEHLMSDFEDMKTSLYLIYAVVFRHEGDAVNLLGLEITKTSKGFEVKNSTEHVESLPNLYGLENSKTTVIGWSRVNQPGVLNPRQRASAQKAVGTIPQRLATHLSSCSNHAKWLKKV